MDILERVKYKDYTIEISSDEYVENPREWDNLGIMVYKHRKYALGDKEISFETFAEFVNNEFSIIDFENCYMSEKEKDKIDRWIEKNLIVLDLYLYDHSGITMNTTGFSCCWDSGQVGFIYISKEKAKKELNFKILTSARIETIKEYLKNEVSVFDSYISGDCYCFGIINPAGETIDTCGGFYGSDFEKNGLLTIAKENINYDINNKQE